MKFDDFSAPYPGTVALRMFFGAKLAGFLPPDLWESAGTELFVLKGVGRGREELFLHPSGFVVPLYSQPIPLSQPWVAEHRLQGPESLCNHPPEVFMIS